MVYKIHTSDTNFLAVGRMYVGVRVIRMLLTIDNSDSLIS